ncbi:MAG: hypothetical protein KJ676_03725 [Alphaproteobacteria bacterium]|nr:hypothetical protein [Alphaproteobacteria bacterium]MBU1525362.1 hypothetical protein [Alphaproteobacteria bacterium]MBU2118088.1 hypothetical protein [Alphaproteobacteria bacterium]MBU2352486.1 hypothetical protein [Alphaproteobacteria bacterium]MBU2382407.1 hypothetical protein [Alphaproteobacteria bacterium]
MRFASFALVALSALALTGCGLTRLLDRSAAVPVAELDPVVHAAAISRDRAVIWVASNGCTDKDSLGAVVQRRHDGPQLVLSRLRPDDCGQPQSVEMTWTFEELGLKSGESLSVANPYRRPPEAVDVAAR